MTCLLLIFHCERLFLGRQTGLLSPDEEHATDQNNDYTKVQFNEHVSFLRLPSGVYMRRHLQDHKWLKGNCIKENLTSAWVTTYENYIHMTAGRRTGQRISSPHQPLLLIWPWGERGQGQFQGFPGSCELLTSWILMSLSLELPES